MVFNEEVHKFYHEFFGSPGVPLKDSILRKHKYVPIKLGGLSNAPEKYKPDLKSGWNSAGPGSSMMIHDPIMFEGSTYHLSHNFYDVYVRIGDNEKYTMLLTVPYDLLQKKARREKWIRAACYTLTADPENIVNLLNSGSCPSMESMIAPEEAPANLMIPDPLPIPMYPIREIPRARPGYIPYLNVYIEEIPAGGIA